ncbi:hypothetical protein [Halorussus salinisoli]|uniref:hypothetical protein n=1 Tax=Halorussus salinisoli TaxID=2558242 RepID=UPI0010C1D1E6|nr:hypothetical protein [Halorussus salinisoli]
MENGISGRQLGGLLVAVSLLLLGYVGLTGTLSLRLIFFDISLLLLVWLRSTLGSVMARKNIPVSNRLCL